MGSRRNIDEAFDWTRLRVLEAEPVTLASRYELVRCVGVGAFGTVYEAVDTILQRRVAIKVLEAGYMEDKLAQLRREARALAKLEHANIMWVLDFGFERDQHYLVLQFLEGPSLQNWIKAPRKTHEILERFLEAGRGLAAAHDVGVVHRDFKPANVLLHRGQALVVDFGLARNEASLADERTSSSIRLVAGTLPYMAPEQLRLDPATTRSDQFSFCVALWEALAGARPFSISRREHRELPPRRGRGIPRRLLPVLRRGLAAEPLDRYPTMRELLAELEDPPSTLGAFVARVRESSSKKRRAAELAARRKELAKALHDARWALGRRQFEEGLRVMAKARDLALADETEREQVEALAETAHYFAAYLEDDLPAFGRALEILRDLRKRLLRDTSDIDWLLANLPSDDAT